MNPNIEEFIKLLRREKSSYITSAELGVHPKIKERLLGCPILTLKDDVQFWYQAGYDYIKIQPGADFNPDKIGVSPKPRIPDDGSLSYNWATEGQGIITSLDDLERYRFPQVSDFDYSKFEKVQSLLPDGMGVIGQYGDIFTLTWEMMGMEGFSMALFENPELVKQLNDKIGNLVLSMFEYFARDDSVNALWFSDDIAFTNALLMSPEVLHQYFFPWLKKIARLAKQANKPLIFHTDGVLWDVLDDIVACGVDALHPIEPKAMDIKDVKEKYGQALCLIGHVDVDLLARGTENEVRKIVRTNFEQAGYDGGYIIGSGNSIPDYVNFNNYLAMLDEVKKMRG